MFLRNSAHEVIEKHLSPGGRVFASWDFLDNLMIFSLVISHQKQQIKPFFSFSYQYNHT